MTLRWNIMSFTENLLCQNLHRQSNFLLFFRDKVAYFSFIFFVNEVLSRLFILICTYNNCWGYFFIKVRCAVFTDIIFFNISFSKTGWVINFVFMILLILSKIKSYFSNNSLFQIMVFFKLLSRWLMHNELMFSLSLYILWKTQQYFFIFLYLDALDIVILSMSTLSLSIGYLEEWSYNFSTWSTPHFKDFITMSYIIIGRKSNFQQDR